MSDGGYPWSLTKTTTIQTDDISKLTVSITVNTLLATGRAELRINSSGYVEIYCSGSASTKGKVFTDLTLTGTYPKYTGKVNQIVFNGNQVWSTS